jgi:hypothetical protein
MKHLDEEQVAQTIKLLEQTRKSIIAELISSKTEYQQKNIGSILVSLQRTINEFKLAYTAQLTGAQAAGWKLGLAVVDQPLAVSNIKGLLTPHLSTELLETAQGFSADLIRDVSEFTRQSVANEIRLGIFGGKTPMEVAEAVGLKVDKGRFKTIHARAVTITRTETNRVMGMATYQRLLQMHSSVPQLEQQWDATEDERVRPEHHAADGQVRKIGKPFNVGGESLLFPGDPHGSGGNTINCRCRVIPYFYSWQDVINPEFAQKGYET